MQRIAWMKVATNWKMYAKQLYAGLKLKPLSLLDSVRLYSAWYFDTGKIQIDVELVLVLPHVQVETRKIEISSRKKIYGAAKQETNETRSARKSLSLEFEYYQFDSMKFKIIGRAYEII